MAEPLLTEAFGASATAATGTLTITLSEIDEVLTENSSAEAILIGLVKKFRTVQDSDPAYQVRFGPTRSTLVQRGTPSVPTWQNEIPLVVFAPANPAAIDLSTL